MAAIWASAPSPSHSQFTFTLICTLTLTLSPTKNFHRQPLNRHGSVRRHPLPHHQVIQGTRRHAETVTCHEVAQGTHIKVFWTPGGDECRLSSL
ncbi:hypothetical protein B0J12DRAFT_655121 [Macrophomina phaseolina]|uniref:Secreted protein n=1 Tax=Macrophomina phaseolina TaxID=35725 RepID=A0ABQ8GGM4_9PEZI|nr:hypothetical protein B0J12DRAFT_655121 [Macrophomina phaseolina]